MLKQLNRFFTKKIRSFSINQLNLISTSQHIQLILKSLDEKCSNLKQFSQSLDEIHEIYSSESQIAILSKDAYQENSSRLNPKFKLFENQRKQQTDLFDKDHPNQLILLLRYIRYLNITYIYRLITYDHRLALKQTSDLILLLSNQPKYFQTKFFWFDLRFSNRLVHLVFSNLSLICELIFYLKYFSRQKSSCDIKSDLSKTLIINYLFENILSYTSRADSQLLINEFCQALYAIDQMPESSLIQSFSSDLFEYLFEKKLSKIWIIKYLILIEHNRSDRQSSVPIMRNLLNNYLNQIGIDEKDLNVLCELLILMCSLHYSHELFHQHLLQQIQQDVNRKMLSNEIELSCRLIFYLCKSDPTNRFQSRSIILQLSEQISKNLNKTFVSPQWLVQAQYGMMLVNLYNYQLLFATIKNQYFPLLFRNLGNYSSQIFRQLYVIHHALISDRSTLEDRLLNTQMLEYANKISNEHRLSIRFKDKTYHEYLNQLKDSFNQIYGNESCQIIHTDRKFPYLFYDFLELNLSDRFQSIGIPSKQRIVILPITKSMSIKQQRSDGSLVSVLAAQTLMRYRIIQKNNYLVIPIFHSEFIQVNNQNQLKTIFETRLALKTLPHSLV